LTDKPRPAVAHFAVAQDERPSRWASRILVLDDELERSSVGLSYS
jgi:hypothetical protein